MELGPQGRLAVTAEFVHDQLVLEKACSRNEQQVGFGYGRTSYNDNARRQKMPTLRGGRANAFAI